MDLKERVNLRFAVDDAWVRNNVLGSEKIETIDEANRVKEGIMQARNEHDALYCQGDAEV